MEEDALPMAVFKNVVKMVQRRGYEDPPPEKMKVARRRPLACCFLLSIRTASLGARYLAGDAAKQQHVSVAGSRFAACI